MSDFDSPWKEALERWFEAFMAFFFPEIHAAIDWSRGYRFLDKELQQIVGDAELGKRLVDKLVQVWRKDGQEAWVLIHIEVQSQEEAAFGERMYVYHYRLFDRYHRPIVSLAVLGDDNPAWRPDRYRYELWNCGLDFRFPTVKLLDYVAREAELMASDNPFATIVLAHLKTLETRRDPLARRNWKVQLTKGLYERGFSRVDVIQLFRLIDWMMTLPKDLKIQFSQEIWQYEQEKHMPYVTTWERDGQCRGLLRGIELGLKRRFGSAGQTVLEELRKVDEVDVLDKVLVELETAETPEDLRRLYQPAAS